MKNNFKTSKCAIIAILTFCLLFCISGTQVFASMAAATEDIPVATENITQELMPRMARGCGYDYKTVDECMRAISLRYEFDYSPNGNSYTCSGGYSVLINNSHNYLNVVLSYNDLCIGMWTCRSK